ncbi:MAG TPA: hypothetical protein VIV60_35125, partial [Polyangiaceae bacterium]
MTFLHCLLCGCASSEGGFPPDSAGSGAPAGGTAGAAGVTRLDAGVIIMDDASTSNNATCGVDGGKCYAVVDAGPYCGDGVVQNDLSETCDDANRLGGDGCSGTCKLEP